MGDRGQVLSCPENYYIHPDTVSVGTCAEVLAGSREEPGELALRSHTQTQM